MSFFESIFYMAWRGLAIGLIISAPMGPVGMLCIQRTLDKGRRAGLYTGVGAAISDLFYCLLTGFGLSFIEEFINENSNVIQLFGSAVLIAFGIYLFRKNPSRSLKKPVEEQVSLQKNILGGFLFTFSNPLILFLTIGLFARFNFLLPEFTVPQYFTGFAFIFLGALLWWWLITFLVNKVRNHFNIRSMWLINKIIGIIIMLFAIVGIITATTALVKAETIRCWNERRGFDSFCPGWSEAMQPKNINTVSTGHLKNETGVTRNFLTDSDHTDKLEFRFKAKNHKPTSKNSWGLTVQGANDDIVIDIQPAEGNFDGISTTPMLRVTTVKNGSIESSELFGDDTSIVKKVTDGMEGPDPTGHHNFFKLVIDDGCLSLYGGLHIPEKLVTIPLSEGFRTDSIGFHLSPGASVEFSEIRLTTADNPGYRLIWDDPELLEEYLEQSRRPLEGYWQILDRSLEETLLKPGGDYRFAIVKSGDGYDLIYLSGAIVNADNWKKGMVKARMLPSGIGDIWNVEWIDAMHNPLSYELKAQTDPNGVLTIQFPYQSSTLRLIRTR